MIDTSVERVRNAVKADRWDQIDWQSTHDRMPDLEDLADRLEEAHWTAPRLAEDVWQALHQGFPQTVDVDPAFKPNRKIVDELVGSDAMLGLRQHTVDDKIAAALGVLSMGSTLSEMVVRLQDVQEKADEAQRRRDAARDAAAAEGNGLGNPPAGDPGSDPGGSGSGSTVADLEAAAADAEAELDAAIDAEVPAISRAIRQAVEAAEAEAGEAAERAALWGLGKGDLVQLDPAERLAAMAELDTAFLKRLAALWGAMRNETWGARDSNWERGPDEIHDIELGNDLTRVLPAEFAAFTIPELEDLFYLKFTQKQLMQYKLRAKIRQARGRIIFIEDGSDSMHWAGGLKHLFVKALGLALLGIAKDEGRGFCAIVFGGPDQVQVFDFPEPAAFTSRKMLDYATASFDGAGTDFRTPLNVALEQLRGEYAELGRTEADIVFATDGDAALSDAWIDEFEQERARLKFNVFGLIVQGPVNRGPLPKIANKGVARIETLRDGTDVAHVFQALTA